MKGNSKKHLATISILVKDRHAQAPDVNKILTDRGNLVMSRLGINVQQHCIENCTAIIVVVVEGSTKEIDLLVKDLDGIYGIIAKKNVLTE